MHIYIICIYTHTHTCFTYSHSHTQTQMHARTRTYTYTHTCREYRVSQKNRHGYRTVYQESHPDYIPPAALWQAEGVISHNHILCHTLLCVCACDWPPQTRQTTLLPCTASLAFSWRNDRQGKSGGLRRKRLPTQQTSKQTSDSSGKQKKHMQGILSLSLWINLTSHVTFMRCCSKLSLLPTSSKCTSQIKVLAKKPDSVLLSSHQEVNVFSYWLLDLVSIFWKEFNPTSK